MCLCAMSGTDGSFSFHSNSKVKKDCTCKRIQTAVFLSQSKHRSVGEQFAGSEFEPALGGKPSGEEREAPLF